MSEAPGSRKSLAGWTLVDSKGEVMTDDSRSVSSESSTESFSLLQDDSGGGAVATAASMELSSEGNTELEDSHNLPSDTERVHEIPLPNVSDDGDSSLLSNLPPLKSREALFQSADITQCLSNPNEPFNETDLGACHSTSDKAKVLSGKVEYGACCEGLMESTSEAKNQQSVFEECRDTEEKEEMDNIPLDVDSSIPSPSFPDDENREIRQRHSSDSDSDFVQINEENLVEFEAELSRSRDGIQDRSPSIAEGFNFLGPAGEGIRDEPPGSGDISDREEEDFNEDTESSTEDIGDDRIESDQSEVGSVMNNNNPTDVGDLSAFADIGDLPLVAGNVARNYRHRPNKGLSTVLNVILIVVSLLTMGISIGLIMATDQEIEEWQQAYNIQAKKVSSLEWTLADLNRIMQVKVNAYEYILKSFHKSDIDSGGSSEFFSNLPLIVSNFESCTRKPGHLTSFDCRVLVQQDIHRTLSEFKEAVKSGGKNSFDFDEISKKGLHPAQSLRLMDQPTQSTDQHQKLQEMQFSLQREQERALHWQNLYLLERRQREWERENEDLEDQRERAQWEKEDEEEDRIMREEWEKEEAENDRKERLLWEREDQEQDRLERKKWEEERAEADDLECLKKLMNTNLTFFKQHLVNWNVSAFNDFVNMSVLMSNIAEMKQSVLASVQQIWVEAEETLKKMGDDVKNGKRPYLDTSMMADYLKQALSILQSQFDDVTVHPTNFSEKEKADSSKINTSAKAKNQKGPKVNNDNTARQQLKTKKIKESGIWNKTVGKLFKKTSKSLRKLVRTVGSSWREMLSLWEKKASDFLKTEENVPKEPKETLSFPPWLQGKSCHNLKKEENVVIDIGSACLWDVRESLMDYVLGQECYHDNRYSLACNVDTSTVWRLKRDLKKIIDVESNFRRNKMVLVEGHRILGMFSKFWKQWENNELLLKSDKDWASCLLKEWSDAVYSVTGWTKSTGSSCDRLVHLKTVFTDIEMRIIYPSEQSKKPKEDVDIEDEDDAIVEDSFHGSEENTHEMHAKYFSSQFDDEDEDIHVYEHYNNNDSKIDNSTPLEKNSLKKAYKTTNFTGIELDESDNLKQTAWYLKRAQYRLEMRRAQEKANWFFDISHHRDEMRKEHNTEIKSGQWFFDQGDEREVQRRKNHEADWMFDRAQHRRKEFAKKWSHGHQRHTKMEDLSKSDWLLQNNQHSGRRGKGMGGNAFKNIHKENQKLDKNNKEKLQKEHSHKQEKQHSRKQEKQHIRKQEKQHNHKQGKQHNHKQGKQHSRKQEKQHNHKQGKQQNYKQEKQHRNRKHFQGKSSK